MIEWWRIKPRQSAPPRTTAMSPGSSGRFIANEELLRNEVATGRKTAQGQALELPQVAPVLSYLLAVINAAAYTTLVHVSFTQGPAAVSELVSAVGYDASGLAHGELWRLASSLALHTQLGPLALALYGLTSVAPRVEAVTGYSTFLTIFALSGLTSATALLFTDAGHAASAAAEQAAAAAGAAEGVLQPLLQPAGALADAASTDVAGLGALFGLLGCALVQELRNGSIASRASQPHAISGTSGGGAAAAAAAAAGGQAAVQQQQLDLGALWSSRAGMAVHGLLLAAGGVAVALQGPPGAAEAHAVQLGAGFLAGAGLAWRMGPKYQVMQEVHIPDGAMHIPNPDELEEMFIVLDQTTNVQRTVAAGSYAMVLLAASGLGVLLSAR